MSKPNSITTELNTLKGVAFRNHLFTVKSLIEGKFILPSIGLTEEIESCLEEMRLVNLDAPIGDASPLGIRLAKLEERIEAVI